MPPSSPSAKFSVSPTTSGTEAISAIRSLIRRGEYLAAYDAAEETEAHDFHPPLGPVALAEIRYLQVLALARSGSSRRALAEAASLATVLPADQLPPALAEDIAALSARASPRSTRCRRPGPTGRRWPRPPPPLMRTFTGASTAPMPA